MSIKDLREQRGKLVADARALLEKAKQEKRDFNSDEQKQYDTLIAEQDKVRQSISNEERLIEAEREAAAAADKGEGREKPKGGKEERAAREMEGLRGFLFGNPNAITEEFRALQADADTTGGYLTMPEMFVNNLIKAVDNIVFIRQKATKYQVPKAQSLGAPSLKTDPADADWTSELATGSEDSDMAFGKRALNPHPLAKRIKISNKLLRLAMIGPEALVRDRLAYKFGVTEEKAFLTGSGAQQPLGVFTASSDGISTGRDVSTGNSTTSIQFDGLIEAKYSLKAQYQAIAEWLFHRDALKQIAKLKDGDGQYIWQPSKRDGDPDRLLGLPFNMSEYAPNTFTTGQYVGILGDFSHYWIADAMDMQMQRLVELYAESNQTGFIGRRELDGMPVLEEAFARVKLA